MTRKLINSQKKISVGLQNSEKKSFQRKQVFK